MVVSYPRSFVGTLDKAHSDKWFERLAGRGKRMKHTRQMGSDTINQCTPDPTSATVGHRTRLNRTRFSRFGTTLGIA